MFIELAEESLELFERSLVVLETYPQVKACLAELGQRIFGTGKVKFIYHVKHTQKEMSEVIPIEDITYIKYKRSNTIIYKIKKTI